MMIRLTLLLLLSIPSALYGQEMLERFCAEVGGTVVASFQCPKSRLQLQWNFCLSLSPYGRPLFTDGCTGPSGGHTELFYPACIKHDYCYHHEPVTGNLSRKNCDDEFLENSLKLCQKASNLQSCQKWANAMYLALRSFGNIAFNCAEYEADYRN